MACPINLAKITAPRVGSVYYRDRLSKLLDESLRQSTVWVSSPAGSGKTTFIADYLRQKKQDYLWYQLDDGDSDLASFFYYLGLAEQKANGGKYRSLPLLTPEYLAGLPAFTRNFFRELFNRLSPNSHVVFDNYQDVPSDSYLHQLLPLAMAEIPAHIRLIVISRFDPPAPYAKIRTSDQMAMITWSDLSLSADEVSGLAASRTGVMLDAAQLRQLMSQFEGWVTGLVLWLERHKGNIPQATELNAKEQQLIFQYFSNEMFSLLPTDTQEFLLKTAYLPYVYVETAKRITNNENSASILLNLLSNNYFVTQPGHDTYRYHPLFKDFLLHKAASIYTNTQQLENFHRAAEALLKEGANEEAIKIILKSRDWDLISRLIVEQSPILIQQGRFQTVAAWLHSVPQEVFGNNPWLTYWRAMAHMVINSGSAKKDFTDAYQAFVQRRDPVGIYSAWSGVVDSYTVGIDDFIGLDHWFDEYQRISRQYSSIPDPMLETKVCVSMVSALVMRRPWQQDVEKWIERAVRLVKQSAKVSLQVQCFFYWGYFDICYRAAAHKDTIQRELERLYDHPDATPYDKIMILFYQTFWWQLHTAPPDNRSTPIVEKALRIADESGVVILNHMIIGQEVYQEVSRNQLANAEKLLNDMRQSNVRMSQWDEGFYYHLKGVIAWFKDDVGAAVNELATAHRIGTPVGECSSTMLNTHLYARVLADYGDLKQARIYLDQSKEMFLKVKADDLLTEYALTEALFAIKTGDENKAIQWLNSFINYPEKYQLGSGRVYFWRPATLSAILSFALEHHIGVPFIQEIIRQRQLLPGTATIHLENWPWKIRLYTLGRFSVVIDDQPVKFTGKGQKKPLELLKALIAFGGRDVSEEKLAEVLWPDVDGDVAHKNFDTNVHRLRKIIGTEAIAVNERKVSLNDQYCWVDAWAFERLLGEIESQLGDQCTVIEKFRNNTKRALSLYQNHFLANETEHSWALSLREKLRQRWLRTLKKLVQYYGRNHLCGDAIELYERALLLDDLAEVLYRGLMGCYAAQGKCAEALSVYQRCKIALRNLMDIEPSEKTIQLFHAIKSGNQSPIAQHCEACRGLTKPV